MNSGTVLAGTEGCTSMAKGSRAMLATGAVSRMKLKLKLVVEGGVDRVHESGHKERISVRGRVHDHLGGDIAGSSWSVLDDELLAEPLRQPLSYQACHDVGATGGGKSDNDAHRPRRIGLRPSDARHGRQRSRAGGEMQKISARKF